MKRLFLFVLFYCISVYSILGADDWSNSPYYDTSFLRQYDSVCRALKEKEGLVEGFFQTEDHVSINYLWLKRPNARHTIVFCSGFWPGRKEGLATFYAMLPDDCNLLFFDARGHGKSTGKLFSRLWRYGFDEYKDVIAAIHWASRQQACPIIVYGVCAGAFHATHAILHLQERGMLHRWLRIKGLIFDSGWSSISEASRTAFASELNGFVYKKGMRLFKNYDVVQKTIKTLLEYGVNALHFCTVRPVLYWRRSQDLSGKMGQLDVSVFYIHAEGDEYARIGPVKKLAEQTKRAKHWWIKEPSKHACHQLKLKEQYRERVLDFIANVRGK